MAASATGDRLRYQRLSAAARRLLSQEGESGRVEFKQTSKAVDSSVLVAAANWVALDPSRTEVTILAGVAEVTDPVTGLTTGKPIGLTGNDLAVHIRRIQDYARATLPVPVSVRIIEEGVSTKAAILRIEVRPTRPPHFDGSGRRITRDGAARTIEAVESLNRGLGGIAGEVERLPDLIDNAEGAAAMAGYEADDAKRAIEDLGRELNARVDRLEERLARHLNRTPLYVLLRLRYVRERVWRAFCVDRVLRPSKAAEKLAPRLLSMLNQPLDPDSHAGNLT